MTQDLHGAARRHPDGCSSGAWLEFALPALFCAAYLTPVLVNLAHNNYIAYTNGWDEETYLSYQGALAFMGRPGYASASLVVLLHNLGLSGGLQNLLFDVVAPLATLHFTRRALLQLGVERAPAAIGSCLLVFGSVLFNRANPMIWVIWEAGSPRLGVVLSGYPPILARPLLALSVLADSPHWVMALESYPSILRTPNPQLSYVLVSGFALLCLRTRRLHWLFWPLPLLYWAVGIPYLYVLVAVLLYRRARSSSLWTHFAVAGLALALTGAATRLLVRTALDWDDTVRYDPSSLGAGAQLALSPPLLFGGVALAAILAMCRRRESLGTLRAPALVATSGLFFITNLPLLARVRLYRPGLQDAAGSLLASFLLCLLLHGLRDLGSGRNGSRVFRLAPAVALVLVLATTMVSQGFDIGRLQYRVFLNQPLSNESVGRIKSDATHAVLLASDLRGRATLMAPRLLAPPFAYQYHFPRVYNRCSLYSDWLGGAQAFISREPELIAPRRGEESDIARAMEMQWAREKTWEGLRFRPPAPFCSPQSFSAEGFFVVHAEGFRLWGRFPDW